MQQSCYDGTLWDPTCNQSSWLFLDWLEGRVGRMGICCSRGIFRARSSQVGDSGASPWFSCGHLPCCTGFRPVPPPPANMQPGQLHSWKPESLGHQLFPILNENNTQANKTKQKIRFFIWQSTAAQNCPIHSGKVGEILLPIFYCKTSSSASEAPLLPPGKGAK